MKWSVYAASVGLAVSLALPAAQAQKKYDEGATDTTIKIGMAGAYSGPGSPVGVVGRVNEAYWKMINDRGGINGRKIEFVTYDDQYSPPRSIEVTRRMVEQDKVLAVYGTMGTAQNLATAKYLNGRKVPQLFIGSGAGQLSEPKTLPWTVPMPPSVEAEARVYAKNILKTKPDAKIAVLWENNDFGKEGLRGLQEGLGDRAKTMIVGQASYELTDPTVDSQIVQLKASGANVFVAYSTARFTPQAIRKAYDIGWRPEQTYVSYSSAYVKGVMEPAGIEKSTGTLSVAFFKDPAQSRWADDQATKDFNAFMAKYAPNDNDGNATAAYAFVVAEAMAHVLRSAGDNLTRDNLLKQATSLRQIKSSMLLPGITLNTSETQRSPVRILQLVRFNGKEFEPVGEPISVN